MVTKANHNCLNEIRDPHIFEMLRQMSPPLFCSEDVSKHCLLHNAARRGSLDTIKYFCDLDPSCLSYLYQKDRYKTIPLCIALIAPFDISTKQHQDLLQYLLQEAVSYDPSNETIGCLFTTVNILENDFLVNCIVKHFGMERTWDLIERALLKQSKLNNLPCILHQIIRYTPQHCSEVIKRFPNSLHVRDKNNMNRLPIHVALETGMKWSLELKYLIFTSHKYLKEVDPVTKLPPFIFARIDTSCDLRIIYNLLHKYPEHVERVDFVSGDKCIAVGNHKRRKI